MAGRRLVAVVYRLVKTEFEDISLARRSKVATAVTTGLLAPLV